MPLRACRECGKDVSTEAKTCPHCGVSSPTAKIVGGIHAGRVLMALIVLIVLSFFYGKWFIHETEEALPACRSDWTKCEDNKQLVNEYKGWRSIRNECKSAAEKRVKYGDPKWPSSAFITYRNGNDYVTSGKAVAVERDAQFSNAYGAMVHMWVTCDYDLRENRVIDVKATENR